MLQNQDPVAVLYFPPKLHHEVSSIMFLWLHQSYLNFSTNKLQHIHSPITVLCLTQSQQTSYIKLILECIPKKLFQLLQLRTPHAVC